MNRNSVADWYSAALEKDADIRELWIREECPADLAEKVITLLGVNLSSSSTSILLGCHAAAVRPETEFVKGDRIGGYELTGERFEGGMGYVYRAKRADGEFHGDVAIKILTDLRNVESFRRFQAEKEISASLKHPHVARFMDAGTEPSTRVPYIIMEWIDGASITSVATAQRLGIGERVALILQVCDALSYLHRQPIVHRDLKPSNILVTHGLRQVKLLDFGIAKLLREETDGSAVARPTETGTSPLTWQYASPEQAGAGRVTVLTDVHGAGLLLYELLAGEPAFHFTGAQLNRAAVVLSQIPPPAGVAAHRNGLPRVPRDLELIVQRAIEKNPDDRYPSCAALAIDLKAWQENRPISGRRSLLYRITKLVRRNPVPSFLAAASIAAMAVAGVNVLQRMEAQRETERSFEEVRRIARLTLFDTDRLIRDLPGSTPARQYLVRTATEYLSSLTSRSSSAPLQLLDEVADGYTNLGDLQGNYFMHNLGDPEGAQLNYAQALRIRKTSLATFCRQCPEKIAGLYLRIGDVHFGQGEFEKAGDFYRQGLELAKVAASPSLQASSLGRLVTWHLASGRPAQAVEAGLQSLQLQRDLKGQKAVDDSNAEAAILANLGNAYAIQRQFEAALLHLNRAIAFLRQLKMDGAGDLATNRFLAVTLVYRGMANRERGLEKEAAEDFSDAIRSVEPSVRIDPQNVAYRKALALACAQAAKQFASLGNRPRAEGYAGCATEHYGFLAKRTRATVNDVNDYLDNLLKLPTMGKSSLSEVQRQRDRMITLVKADNPIYLDTLGTASCAIGEKVRGREFLNRALRMLPLKVRSGRLGNEIQRDLQNRCL